MASQPILVVIPGSFSWSYQYDAVVEPLRAKGHTVHVLEPPSYPAGYKANPENPLPSMYDDAKFINEFVGKLVDEGKEVVIFAHSYGGCPATESLKGVTKKEREQQGKKGGVVRIVYLTAAVPRVGESLRHIVKGGKGAPIDVGEDGWMSQPDPAATAEIVYNDLPPAVGTAEAAKFGKHSSVSFGNELTHAGYKDLPVSWFCCENDLCVLPEVQQTAIDVIEENWKGTERDGKKVDVKRVKCDHCPFVDTETREALVDWIEEVLQKGGKE